MNNTVKLKQINEQIDEIVHSTALKMQALFDNDVDLDYLTSIIFELGLLVKFKGAECTLEVLRRETEEYFQIEAEKCWQEIKVESAEWTKCQQPDSTSVCLNKDQKDALQALNEWYRSEEKAVTFSGAAGTGKTFTIGYWLQQLESGSGWPEWVQNCWNDWRQQLPWDISEEEAWEYWTRERDEDDHEDWETWIYDWLQEDWEVETIFLSPTHKAKNVLKHSLVDSGIDSPAVYTIAQALGKQPVIIETGCETFQMQADINLISDADLVIIDEASMVGQEDYLELLNRANKILFMGDKNQLPPVGEHAATAFINPPNCELKQVMRYSGHILNECHKLREGVEQNFIHRIEPDGNKIIRLNRWDAWQKAAELMKSKEFQDDSTFARILAFRNVKVDANNKYLKPKIYDRNDDYFEGLRLIANKPVQRKDGRGKWQIYCNNSEEIKVLSDPKVVEIDDKLLAAMPNDCQELKKLYGKGKATIFKCFSDGGIEFESIILDHKANLNKQNIIKIIQQKYQQSFSKNYKGALAFLYRWGDNLKDIFSSTVHKSQGSTYNHVFIELSDILRPPSQRKKSDPDDRPKLLYTAVSRASERVYLID